VGELLRVNAADEAEEGISDRGKSLPSRGAVKAISILRATTQAVLQRRKRDPEGDGVSETKSCTERDHVAFLGAKPHERHAPVTTRPRCRTARRSGSSASWNDGPFGRTTGSNRHVTKQAEIRERGYRFQEESGWQKSVGRIAAIVWEHGSLARGRSTWRWTHTAARARAKRCAWFFKGYFYRRPRGIRFVRESVRRPLTTEGVSDRSQRALLTGRTGGGPDLQVKATRPVTARVVSWLRGLEPRSGACRWRRNVRRGCSIGKGSSSLVRRGGSASETHGVTCKNDVGRNRESVDAPEEIHGSWRQRIAALRLATRIQPARTVLGPERATPLPRCVGELPGTWAAHEVRNALRKHAEALRA